VKNVIIRGMALLCACFTLAVLIVGPVLGGECTIPPRLGGYRIFYHNSGVNPNCVNDYDMDIPEYRAFLSEYASFLAQQRPALIGDNFLAQCQEPTPYVHAYIVKDYLDWVYGNDISLTEEASEFPWVEFVNHIANNPAYHRTVTNLSNGLTGQQGWHQDATDAIMNAYNHEVLLVGTQSTFSLGPTSIGDKALTCLAINATGEFCDPYAPETNTAAVGVPTNWFNSTDNYYYLATAGESPAYTSGYPQEGYTGSFSTALLSGTVARIADIVAARGVPEGQFIPTVLDYVISACDRNVDPETYSHVSGQGLPTSFGPWSETWGYGVFSPWKSLIYAYGWGKISPRDSALSDGEVADPPVVFSDHFWLRGDLLVPAGKTFVVSPLASVFTEPEMSPEGPTNLGVLADLCEIHVGGSMEVKSTLSGGVSASVTIDDEGLCTVKTGGKITIGYGQELHVYAGGTLTLETGGEIDIQSGGQFIIDGTFNDYGAVTLAIEAQMICSANSQIYLATDLSIPEEASFSAGVNAVITAALTDARETGSDPSHVEIICGGVMNLTGSSSYPVLFKAQTAGAGKWAGISFVTSDESNGSTWSCVRISDAITGLTINASSNPLDLTLVSATVCTTGVKVTGRNDVTLSDGEVWSCTTGVLCDAASPTIQFMSLHGNTAGIQCSAASSPKVRRCTIYGNTNGVITMDKHSLPNIGTTADPGNNSFLRTPANNINITAFDPTSNIYAQNNWWGTTVVSQIQAKIYVIDEAPPGCGSVIFQPFLSGPPPEELRDDPGQQPGTGDTPKAPSTTYLEQNYPNPFNPMTTIRFGLKDASYVSLTIYDASGRVVRTLIAGRVVAGHHEKLWDGKDSRGAAVSSGIYFCKLTANSQVETRKMVLLR